MRDSDWLKSLQIKQSRRPINNMWQCITSSTRYFSVRHKKNAFAVMKVSWDENGANERYYFRNRSKNKNVTNSHPAALKFHGTYVPLAVYNVNIYNSFRLLIETLKLRTFITYNINAKNNIMILIHLIRSKQKMTENDVINLIITHIQININRRWLVVDIHTFIKYVQKTFIISSSSDQGVSRV